jgi:hypothetical protein
VTDDPLRRIRKVLPTLAGDVCVIVVVLGLGIVRHRGLEGLGDLPGVAETVTPFLLGWFVLAPLLGAYGEPVLRDRGQAVLRGVGAWIGAAVLGSAIRSTAAFSGGATPVFVAVVAGTGGIAIAIWRFLGSELGAA